MEQLWKSILPQIKAPAFAFDSPLPPLPPPPKSGLLVEVTLVAFPPFPSPTERYGVLESRRTR